MTYIYPKKEPEIASELLKALLLAHQRELDTLKQAHSEMLKVKEECLLIQLAHQHGDRRK